MKKPGENQLAKDYIPSEKQNHKIRIKYFLLGPFLYYVRGQGHRGGWVGGAENGTFLLLYLMKMSLCRVLKSLKNP
jgi:hypothetical protein